MGKQAPTFSFVPLMGTCPKAVAIATDVTMQMFTCGRILLGAIYVQNFTQPCKTVSRECFLMFQTRASSHMHLHHSINDLSLIMSHISSSTQRTLQSPQNTAEIYCNHCTPSAVRYCDHKESRSICSNLPIPNYIVLNAGIGIIAILCCSVLVM